MNSQISGPTQHSRIPQQGLTIPNLTTMNSYKEMAAPLDTSAHGPRSSTQTNNNDSVRHGLFGQNFSDTGTSTLASRACSTQVYNDPGKDTNFGTLSRPTQSNTSHKSRVEPFPRITASDPRIHQSWASAASIWSPVNDSNVDQPTARGAASKLGNWNESTANRSTSLVPPSPFDINASRAVDQRLSNMFSNRLQLENTHDADLRQLHQNRNPFTESDSPLSLVATNGNSRAGGFHRITDGSSRSPTDSFAPHGHPQARSDLASRKMSNGSHQAADSPFGLGHGRYGASEIYQQAETPTGQYAIPQWKSNNGSTNDVGNFNATGRNHNGNGFYQPVAQVHDDISSETLRDLQFFAELGRRSLGNVSSSQSNRPNLSTASRCNSRDQVPTGLLRNADFPNSLGSQAFSEQPVYQDSLEAASFAALPQMTKAQEIRAFSPADNFQSKAADNKIRPSTMQSEPRHYFQGNKGINGWNGFNPASPQFDDMAHQMLKNEGAAAENRAAQNMVGLAHSQYAPPQTLGSLGRQTSRQAPLQKTWSRSTGNLIHSNPQNLNSQRTMMSSNNMPTPLAQVTNNEPEVNNESLTMIENPLLLEFKANTRLRKHWELKHLFGNIAVFSGDQEGSRFIQFKLESANSEEKQRFFSELLPEAPKLMMDVFGNYVIQKFFEHGDHNQKRILAASMKGHMLQLSCQVYACRVVQKALEHVYASQQVELIEELKGRVLEVVKDQNGNHVIQKIIEHVPAVHLGFIFTALKGRIHELSRNQFGCRVVQRMLDKCGESCKKDAMREIVAAADSLIGDWYGNYVIQHIIQEGTADERREMIDLVLRQMVQHSKSKFASNVVEKCIIHGTPKQLLQIVTKLYQPDNKAGEIVIAGLIKDPYGNYVVQKLLDNLEREDCLQFIPTLSEIVARIQGNGESNKHVENILEKIKNCSEKHNTFRQGSNLPLYRIDTSTSAHHKSLPENGAIPQSSGAYEPAQRNSICYDNNNNCYGNSKARYSARSGSNATSNMSTPPLTSDEHSPKSNNSFSIGLGIDSPEQPGSAVDAPYGSIPRVSPSRSTHGSLRSMGQYGKGAASPSSSTGTRSTATRVPPGDGQY